MRYRKKPIEVTAVQWLGIYEDLMPLFSMPYSSNDKSHVIHMVDEKDKNLSKLQIITMEGLLTAEIGDYIIRGIAGEFYPCKPKIFELTYEKIE